MKRLLVKSAIVLFAIVFSGCATSMGTSTYYPNVITKVKEKEAYSINNPTKKIVVIFTPGSGHNLKPTPCTPNKPNSPYGIPNVLLDLSKKSIKDNQVILDGFCSKEVGTKFSKYSIETKPEARSKDIIKKIEMYVKSGIPEKHIFISGHSVGGWTALLVGQKLKYDIGGIIAFAPAFAGKYKTRTDFWKKIYKDRINKLKQSEYINGIVFAFKGDPFNKQEDLSFLKYVKGIKFVPLSDEYMEEKVGYECSEFNKRNIGKHKSVYKECFRESQNKAIINFIKSSL